MAKPSAQGSQSSSPYYKSVLQLQIVFQKVMNVLLDRSVKALVTLSQMYLWDAKDLSISIIIIYN